MNARYLKYLLPDDRKVEVKIVRADGEEVFVGECRLMDERGVFLINEYQKPYSHEEEE